MPPPRTPAPAGAAAPPAAGADPAGFRRRWTEPPGLLGALRTVNNVPIARRYMIAGFAFFVAGGVQAVVLRVQLAWPEGSLLSPERYNQLFTMHGTTMMFLFVIPFIEALANYVMPLMLGTRDLPFPRLTALSFWTYLFGGLFLYSSFWVGAVPDTGWFAYVPLTSEPLYSPGLAMDFWDIGLSVAEVAAMAAAAELIIAILRMRAVGMSLHRLPLFAWAMLITAFMIIFAFTPLIVGTAMLELDRKGLTAFFDPGAGGAPLLWQHLFWVFGHPEVYIMFLPAVGIVSQVVQTFARRPVVSYTAMVLAMLSVGFVSFGLWVHHMFTTGLPPAALSLFAAASMGIAIPTGVQVVVWIATLWLGRPVWRTPLLFVAGFLVTFVAGGLTGVMVAAVPFNWQVHDTYFVVAHFHYVLIGGVVFPLFAGLYYWLPKVTGRRLDERLGRWNFWLMLVAFHVTFFPMHLSGLAGMPRRVYTYPADSGWATWNLVSTAGAVALALGVALFLVNVARSLRSGAPAGADPWDADTLEWSQASPAPEAQFPELPVVRSRHPLWDAGPDTGGEAPEGRAVAEALAHRPVAWRGALVVSALDARPLALAHLPGPTIAPFLLSVGMLGLFVAALTERGALAGAGVVVSLGALAVWFWPQRTERAAIEEMAGPDPPVPLPLAVAGPLANGWWGTLLLLLILAVALASVVASHWYLGAPAALRPAWEGRWAAPAGATLLAGLLGLAPALARRAAGGRRLLGLTAALVAALAFVGVTAHDLGARGLSPSTSAAASGLLGVLGFQWLVTFLAVAMLGVALLWAWRAPADPRAEAVLGNATLVSWFALGSWAVVGATIHVAPHLGG